MGIVIAPLSMALVNALNFVPESGARTRTATQYDATLRAISTDVGNATKVNTAGRTGKITNYAGSPATCTDTVGTGCLMDSGTNKAVSCAASGTTNLFDSRWSDLGASSPTIETARYSLTWTRPAGATYSAVELVRTPSTGSPQTYLTGYCQGTEAVASVDVIAEDENASFNEEVKLTTRLRDTVKGAQATTVFAGFVRSTD
jgi:hypothetical protein